MMPAISALDRFWRWLTTQRNLTILTAILLAVPVAYTFQVAFDSGSGDFLLLMLLAVGVPTAFDEHYAPFDRTWKAIGWVVVACALVTVEFTVLYLVSTLWVGLSPFAAGAAAFLVTAFGNLIVLGRRRPGGTGNSPD